MADTTLSRNTICVQGGYTPGNGEPRQIPIIQSTTFKYDSSDEMGKLFDLEADGYFYSRLANPTCDAVAADQAGVRAHRSGYGCKILCTSRFGGCRGGTARCGNPRPVDVA